MAAALVAAPDHIADLEFPYDPNDAKAVDAYWKDAVVSRSLPELRENLAIRRRGPGSPVKEQVAVRYSVDVLAAFAPVARLADPHRQSPARLAEKPYTGGWLKLEKPRGWIPVLLVEALIGVVLGAAIRCAGGGKAGGKVFLWLSCPA